MSGFIMGLIAGLVYNTNAGKKLAGKVESTARDIVKAAFTPAKGDEPHDE